MINRWRSETLRALVNVPKIAQGRTDWINHASTDLLRYLSSWFLPVRGQKNSLGSLSESIILPAVRLADSVQLSSMQYDFSKIDDPVLHVREQTVEALVKYKVIDVLTRKTVKPNSPIVADENGLIGEPIILLEPGLYRVSGRQSLKLRPATVVFRFNNPVRRQRAEGLRERA